MNLLILGCDVIAICLLCVGLFTLRRKAKAGGVKVVKVVNVVNPDDVLKVLDSPHGHEVISKIAGQGSIAQRLKILECPEHEYGVEKVKKTETYFSVGRMFDSERPLPQDDWEVTLTCVKCGKSEMKYFPDCKPHVQRDVANRYGRLKTWSTI